MVHCVVPFCTSDSRSEKISFHQFPSDTALREKWLAALSREGDCKGSHWIPTQYSSICGKHFAEDDFKSFASKRILKPGAVPCVSIFPDYPKCMQPKNVAKRRKIVKRDVAQSSCKTSHYDDSAIMISTGNSSTLEPLPSRTTYDSNSKAVTVCTSPQKSGINVRPKPSTELVVLRRKCRNLQSLLAKMRKRNSKLKQEKEELKNELETCSRTLKQSIKAQIK